jgi:hypothetical protein
MLNLTSTSPNVGQLVPLQTSLRRNEAARATRRRQEPPGALIWSSAIRLAFMVLILALKLRHG